MKTILNHKFFVTGLQSKQGLFDMIDSNTIKAWNGMIHIEGGNVLDYIIVFLEGIMTFVSPCMLPMLPLYVLYFAGGERSRGKTLTNALGFVLGFSLVFTALGAFAGTLGSFLIRYAMAVNIITGALVVLFGLNYLGILKFNLFRGFISKEYQPNQLGFFSSILFGAVFSIGWTPCVGAFLGSALMLAANAQSSMKGITLLLSFSLGLGIPFVVSALLLNQLKGVFDFIKKHYRVINMISGLLLVALGLAMMTGLMGRLLALFS
jgi:cytochrome c-type biogenesis protein